MLSKSFIMTFLLWIYYSWRPSIIFSIRTIRDYYGYGSKLTVAGLISTVFQNLYFNFIGKFFPLTSLGYYTRAVQLEEFPTRTISSIFSRVVFPVFSMVKNDDDRLRNALKKTMRTAMFITFPVILGLIAVSDEFITVIFTEKWIMASKYFKLLCLVGLFYVLQVINNELIKTKGKPEFILRIEIISKTILVANILITYKYGIATIILGQIVVSIIAYLLGSFYVWKLIGYPVWRQILDISAYLIISLIMFIFVELISHMISTSLITLIVMILVGISLYLLLSYLFEKEDMKDMKIMLVNVLKLKWNNY